MIAYINTTAELENNIAYNIRVYYYGQPERWVKIQVGKTYVSKAGRFLVSKTHNDNHYFEIEVEEVVADFTWTFTTNKIKILKYIK